MAHVKSLKEWFMRQATFNKNLMYLNVSLLPGNYVKIGV